jgi:hypothetical protein
MKFTVCIYPIILKKINKWKLYVTITYVTNDKLPPGGVYFYNKIVISPTVRPATVKSDGSSWKFWSSGAVVFKYYWKVNSGQTIIFGVSELKKSSHSDRQIAGRRLGDGPSSDIDRRPNKHQLANENRPVRGRFMHRHQQSSFCRTAIARLEFVIITALTCLKNVSVNFFGYNIIFMVEQECVRGWVLR